MPTSGETAWSLTALDIVKAAMGEIAVIDPGTDPDPDECEDCVVRLNGMLKSWQLKGVTLMREATATLTTTPATALVPLGDVTDIRSISTARLVPASGSERPLYPMTRSEYLSMPNKATAGSPTMYYFSRQRDEVELYHSPVSATAVHIAIDYDRIVETITANTETLDIREELLETVYANLAVRIFGLFESGKNPPAELIARATTLEQQMFDAERPDSYRFESDSEYA